LKRLHPYLFLFLLLPLHVVAQERSATPQEEDTFGNPIQNSLVPVFGFESDAGLIGGGVWQRIDYGQPAIPFSNKSSVQMTLSTLGHVSGKADYERVESFGRPIRSRFRLEIYRIPNQTFFGIGNDTDFDRDAYDKGLYEFLERSLRFHYWGRKQLVEVGSGGSLDLQVQLSIAGYAPRSVGDETLFELSRPRGYGGGWANHLGGGVTLDHRDSEFNPTSGYRFETTISGGGGVTASDYRFGITRAEGRGYLPMAGWLVLAQRIELQHAIGDVPFQEMPSLGNEMGLRGYALDRFRGQTSILHQLDLRSWLFSVLDGDIRFGGQLFVDTGRVLTGHERLTDLPYGLKQTYGLGGVMSLLNPDFIFRGEVGFSDELYRIYIGIGYLF